jgi:endonuclease I
MYSNVTNYVPGGSDEGGTYSKEGDCYNREHSFPQSWFGESAPMKSDLFHVYPTDGYVNNRRSNYPFGETSGDTYKSANGFSKVGSCTYPGYTGTVFEPNDEYKGDLARVYFYMATCYEAYKTNAGKERSPLDWDKSDKTMLDGTIYPFFKEWAIKMLLRWAIEDPVSEKEINRNAAIFGRQKNRNPFVDYPGLEQYIWGSSTDVAFSYDNYIMPDMSGGNAQGDVNGDGKIDIADVVALSIAILTGSTDLKYDINNDEKVNSEDIIALVNIIVG